MRTRSRTACPFDGADVRALAEASMRHLARRFVVGRGVAETRADLRVGAKLKLNGLGPLFEGDYTRHRSCTIASTRRSGMRTEFRCDRPVARQGTMTDAR